MNLRIGKYVVSIWWELPPIKVGRDIPKSKPPVNYDPTGLWRDYYNLSLEDKLYLAHMKEERDILNDDNRR